MKTAIVTGANGFIGRRLILELLNNEYYVYGIGRKEASYAELYPHCNYSYIQLDLKEIYRLHEMLPNKDIESVFHMAWDGVSGSKACDEDIQLSNIKNTLSLIDYAYEAGVKTFVGAGSMYEPECIIEINSGKRLSNLVMAEKACKLSAHMMAKAKAGYYGMRFFWPYINTYGEYEDSNRLVDYIISSMIRGCSPAVSSGNQIYDFVHVNDVAYALRLIAEKGLDGKNYTIGSGKPGPLKDFLTTIENIVNSYMSSDIHISFGADKRTVTFLPEKMFDINDLCNDTGYTPKISFENGIKSTIESKIRG